LKGTFSKDKTKNTNKEKIMKEALKYTKNEISGFTKRSSKIKNYYTLRTGKRSKVPPNQPYTEESWEMK
jgi:hypothetical protein